MNIHNFVVTFCDVSVTSFQEHLVYLHLLISIFVAFLGAGCISEALRLNKQLIVVVNEKLMGNHQFELAKQLAIDEHLIYCICDHLKDVLETKDLSSLKKFPPGNPQLLTDFLDDILGVKTSN